jgi:hypothetical protein
MRGKPNPVVLFVNDWHHFASPAYQTDLSRWGVRGRDFPEIFESPLSAYWWESQYATLIIGAAYAADRSEKVGPDRIRLSGNGLLAPGSIEVSPNSIIVVRSKGAALPKWRNDDIVVTAGL